MRPKRLPRLWCALQGLLPLEAGVAARGATLARPPEPVPDLNAPAPSAKRRTRGAAGRSSER